MSAHGTAETCGEEATNPWGKIPSENKDFGHGGVGEMWLLYFSLFKAKQPRAIQPDRLSKAEKTPAVRPDPKRAEPNPLSLEGSELLNRTKGGKGGCLSQEFVLRARGPKLRLADATCREPS